MLALAFWAQATRWPLDALLTGGGFAFVLLATWVGLWVLPESPATCILPLASAASFLAGRLSHRRTALWTLGAGLMFATGIVIDATGVRHNASGQYLIIFFGLPAVLLALAAAWCPKRIERVSLASGLKRPRRFPPR